MARAKLGILPSEVGPCPELSHRRAASKGGLTGRITALGVLSVSKANNVHIVVGLLRMTAMTGQVSVTCLVLLVFLGSISATYFDFLRW
jgi:hypothetical protein